MASRICARATATTASPGSSTADASSADSADSARRRTRASETPAGLADLIPPPSFSPDHHASSGGSVSGGYRPGRRDSRDGPETPETPRPPPLKTSSFFSSSPPHPLSRSHFPCARSARNRLLAGVADANRPPSVALLDPGASRSFRESSAAALSASSEAMTHDVANSANASSLIRVPRVVERRASSLARVSSAAFARTIVFVFRTVASSRYAPSASRSAAANASRRAGSAKPRRARASAAAGVSEAACTAERMREAAAAARGASRRRRHSRRVARRGSTTAADAEGVAPLPRETDGTPPKIEDAGADNERGRGGARGGSWG